jgi:curved DNA-binding protein CbpA
MNAYEILELSPGATQEEITKAYKRLALKYHPDRNRGNEEWAKRKFIEVGEAYSALSGSAFKKKFEFSNKPGSDKFKEFEDLLNEVKRESAERKKRFEEYEEGLDRERERLINESIQSVKQKFALAGISASDLDPSLWTPYGDWKEKFRNSIEGEISPFLSKMTTAIEKARLNKINNDNYYSGDSNYGNDDYSSWNSPPPRGRYDDEKSSYSNKNFSSNDGEWMGEKKTNLTSSERIKQLEEDIEYNKDYLLKTTSEKEKQKCREVIARSEKELRKLRNRQNPTQPSSNLGNYSSGNNSSDNNNRKDERDEKINQLEKEIEQLKKNKPWGSQKRQESQKKIAEKEQELSELKKSNEDSDVYGNWYDEWDQEQKWRVSQKGW